MSLLQSWRPGRVHLWLLTAWIALSAMGAGLHTLAARAEPGAHDSGRALETFIKPLANICDVATLGGWPLAKRVASRLSLDAAGVALVANIVGLACWFTILALVLTLRARMVAPRARVDLAAPVNDSTFNLSRRRLFVDGAIAAIGLSGAGTVVRGAMIEPSDLTLRRYTVPIRDLPPELSGLRMVQLSDTHLGPHVPAAHVSRAVADAIALAPDLILVTGDYIHGNRDQIAPAAELFRPLTAPRAGQIGVIGVLGNHDWYADGPASAAAQRAIGVRMIDNARLFLDARTRQLVDHEPETPSLCIAGLGDLLEDHIDLHAAFAGVRESTPRIVLAHNPDTAEHPRITHAGPRIDLMVSGHTHGGQICLPFIGPPLVPSAFGAKYEGGLAQGPVCRVLISRGVGVSVMPIRLGVPPEIVEITLTRA